MKIRYDPVTGQEILTHAPVVDGLVPETETGTAFDVEVLDRYGDPAVTAAWNGEVLAERFSFLATQIRVAYQDYMGVEGCCEERSMLLEPVTEAWQAMEGWGIAPPL